MQVPKEEIRNSILEAALQEFMQNGYEKATMNAIANQCKISKSNLYRYFTSKEEIYMVLMTPAMNEIRRTLTYLTRLDFTWDSYDVAAENMTKYLFPAVREYRKEFLVLMSTSTYQVQQEFREEMIQLIVNFFLAFDLSRMPENFAYVLAGMIMDGITRIVQENEDEGEIYHQLLALFRYHTRGIGAFVDLP